MNSESIQVGLLQAKASEAPEDNIERTLAGLDRLADQGARVVCTQELFTAYYFCQQEKHERFGLAEEIPGPTTQKLQELARRREIVIVASLFERRAPGLFHNTAAVIDASGELLGVYRKTHIPDDPRFYEKFYFTPGDLDIPVWQTRYGPIGVLICWDQWYPEAARLAALRGARILFYPTAIGWLPEEREEFGTSQHNAWETMQRSHAIANGVYVCAVNRVGLETFDNDPGIHFWGQSFVSDPSGHILKRAATDQEEELIVPIDFRRIEEARTHWPFLRDRRIDLYGPLTKRYIDDRT